MGDGWGSDEKPLNHVGTAITVMPPIFGALLIWGVFQVDVPMAPLLAVIAVCGVAGGIVNILGRGPLPAGAIVGPVMALGAFGAVCWWGQERERLWIVEIMIAMMIGTIPGFALQFGIQQVIKRRRDGATG